MSAVTLSPAESRPWIYIPVVMTNARITSYHKIKVVIQVIADTLLTIVSSQSINSFFFNLCSHSQQYDHRSQGYHVFLCIK